MKKVLKVCLVVFLVFIGIVGGFLVERMMPKKEAMETLLGDWVMERDITDMVAARAEAWLEDMEGVTVTAKDLREKMGPLTIEVIDHYEIDETKNALHTKSVSQESYEKCVKKAYEGMTEIFEEFLMVRLDMAGVETDNDEYGKELFTEVLGMTMEDYFRNVLPDLVPSLEEVNGLYAENGRKQVTE